MPTKRFQIAWRQRSIWEAFDLGVAMGRRWCWALWRIWFAVSFLPVVLISFWLREWTLPFGLPDKNIPIPAVLFIIWWFKPLFERALLIVLQQVLFNRSTATGSMLKKTAYSWLSWGIGDLVWRRLSRGRSFIMPITQLEGGSYRTNRQRTKLLRRHYGRIAGLFSLFFGVFEAVLFFGSLLLGYMVLPGAWEQMVFDLLAEHPQWGFWGCIALYYAVLTLSQPFYVACGFALYLHSRTELEAWDIQLRFMQLAQRAKTAKLKSDKPKSDKPKSDKAKRVGRTLGMILLGCFGLGMSGLTFRPVQAEPLPSGQPQVAQVQKVTDDARCTAWKKKLAIPASDPLKRNLQEILKAPEFYPCRTEGRWMKRPNRDNVHLPKWLLRAFENITQGIERIDAERTEPRWSAPWLGVWIKWGLLTALGVAVLVLVARLLYLKTRQRQFIPHAVFEVDRAIFDRAASSSAASPLPTEPLAVVRQLSAAKETRAALSLLYRYTINELTERFVDPIPADATEGECLAIIKKQARPEMVTWCQELIGVWQEVAYAHRLPAADYVLVLCDRWTALMGGEHER